MASQQRMAWFHYTATLAFCTLLGLVQACSRNSVKNIDPGRPIEFTQGSGMIVGSVTAPRVEHYWEVSNFRYRKLDDTHPGVLKSASLTADLLWMKDRPIEPNGTGPDPGLEEQLGLLFAVELEPGIYEIHQLDASGMLLIRMQPVRFEVRAGEIAYIGNLHVRYCLYTPDQSVYRGRVNGGIPSVRDEFNRDLPMLLNRFPALAGKKIRHSLIDDSAWRDLEKTGLPSPETTC